MNARRRVFNLLTFLRFRSDARNRTYRYYNQPITAFLEIGTPLASKIGMESGVDSVLGPIIEKARKDERLPESGLPTLGAMIEAYVGHVLTVTAHNVAQSARILGIARSTLYNRLRHDS